MYALKHSTTGELFTCTLVNIYDFPYHGVKVWAAEAEARAEFASFLVERGVDEPWVWQLQELDENQVRIGNVKLNNNPARKLFLTAEGRLEARASQ